MTVDGLLTVGGLLVAMLFFSLALCAYAGWILTAYDNGSRGRAVPAGVGALTLLVGAHALQNFV